MRNFSEVFRYLPGYFKLDTTYMHANMQTKCKKYNNKKLLDFLGHNKI